MSLFITRSWFEKRNEDNSQSDTTLYIKQSLYDQFSQISQEDTNLAHFNEQMYISSQEENDLAVTS